MHSAALQSKSGMCTAGCSDSPCHCVCMHSAPQCMSWTCSGGQQSVCALLSAVTSPCHCVCMHSAPQCTSWTCSGGQQSVCALLSAVAHVITCAHTLLDRKSTRLNSSHANISYAV